MHQSFNKLPPYFCLLVPTIVASADPGADELCQETEGGPQWQAELDAYGNPLSCYLIEHRCFKGYRDASTGSLECW